VSVFQPVGLPSAKKTCTFLEEDKATFVMVKIADVSEGTDYVDYCTLSIKRLTLDLSAGLKPYPTRLT